ncbi:MAG: hypothetical protein ACLFUW_08705 [Bacteroidales bacterium]
MKIHPATESNIIEALFIIKSSYDNDILVENFWRPPIPNYNELKEEMENNHFYLITQQRISVGTFSFTRNQPESFTKINWSEDNNKTLFIKRIAIAPNWVNDELISSLKEFIDNYAKENNYSSIKFSSLSTKENTHEFYKKLGFTQREPINPDLFESPLSFYEKLL